MIIRIDRLQTAMPPPSDPDPIGASAVQELLGGKFGEIPECQPHIARGEHLKLYRFSQDDFKELAAVFNGPHPETGEPLTIAEEIHPEGAPAFGLPPQPAVFAPGQSRRKSKRSRPNAEAAGCRRRQQAPSHKTQTECPTITARARV